MEALLAALAQRLLLYSIGASSQCCLVSCFAFPSVVTIGLIDHTLYWLLWVATSTIHLYALIAGTCSILLGSISIRRPSPRLNCLSKRTRSCRHRTSYD